MAAPIVLPLGTEYVPTADIPALIAGGLHPDTRMPATVSRFDKTAKAGATGETAKWHGWPIDANDVQVLNNSWAKAGLPPLPDNADELARMMLTAEQVRPYLEAFKQHAAYFDWELDVLWRNPQTEAIVSRHQTEEEHRKALKSAINEGRLRALKKLSRLPAKNEFEAAEVEVNDFISYVSQFGIEVHWSVGKAVVSGNVEEDLRRLKERRAVGRYTLREAAVEIERNTGERADDFLHRLMQAGDALPVHEPGKQARYWPKTVRDFYEEAYWDDLNKWLEANERRIAWRFPKTEKKEQKENAVCVIELTAAAPDWKAKAREIALEYIQKHQAQNLFPNQNDVSSHVAKELRKLKVYGHTGKPIADTYILRNAIQGAWWRANRAR